MKKQFSTRILAQQGLFVAGLTICAWISIPFGDISFTLQTFALYLALFTLGGKRGSVVFFVYLLMGAVGLPVFSGFRGGFGVLLGPTGGYLWGLAFAGPIYWLFTRMGGEKCALGAVVCAMVLCYLGGTLWFLYAYAGQSPWWTVALKCVAPYLLPDAAKIALAYAVSRRLHKVI